MRGFTPTMFMTREDVQRHLGGNLRQALHQKVRRA
jgi:hypothetical protein